MDEKEAVTATDPSGCVTVAVEPDGSIGSLQIALDWLDYLDADGLAPAVTEAYVKAATEAVLPNLPSADEPTGSSGADADVRNTSRGADESAHRALDFSAFTTDEFARLQQELAENMKSLGQQIMSVASQVMSTETAAVTAQQEGATVAMEMGFLRSLDYDVDWLEQTAPRQISEATREAFSLAQQMYAAEVAERQSPLADLEQFLAQANPMSLATKLGIPTKGTE